MAPPRPPASAFEWLTATPAGGAGGEGGRRGGREDESAAANGAPHAARLVARGGRPRPLATVDSRADAAGAKAAAKARGVSNR